MRENEVNVAYRRFLRVYLERLGRQRQRFDGNVAAVGLDAGYATTGIAKGLEDREILGVTGYRNPTPSKEGTMRKSKFVYEADEDGYCCPQGQLLTYATTARNGYKRYRSDPAICRDCPLLGSCTSNANAEHTITRHVWAEMRERTDAKQLHVTVTHASEANQGPMPMPAGRRSADHPKTLRTARNQKTKTRRKIDGFVSSLGRTMSGFLVAIAQKII